MHALDHARPATRPAVPRHFDLDDQGLAICIAPGPSLTYGDLSTIRLAKAASAHIAVITINDAYRHFPQAHYRFCSDGYWWTARSDAYATDRYSGRCFTLEHGGPLSVPRLDYDSAAVLSDDPCVLATGGHGGYSAINLAYLLGATTIALVGYDMQPHPTTGIHHFQGDEPNQRHLRYHLWLPRYRPLCEALAARHTTLINCTRATAIPESDVPRAALASIL